MLLVPHMRVEVFYNRWPPSGSDSPSTPYIPSTLVYYAVYEKASPHQMVTFTFADNTTRRTWDESSMALHPIPQPSSSSSSPSPGPPPSSSALSSGPMQPPLPPVAQGAAGSPLLPPGVAAPSSPAVLPSYCQSSFVYSRTRFPPPMAQREYVFARRVWYKADDGGCYCISKATTHPSPPAAGCRSMRVEDFSAGFVIR